MDTKDPAKSLHQVWVPRDRQKSSRGLHAFANFPVSSFSFISPRVSVIMLKSLKLWVILHFDVGLLFYWKEEAEIGQKGSP